MNQKELLSGIGLTPKESTVYLSLLEHPLQHVSDLSRRTKLHRPDIYTALETLTHKNLVHGSLRGKRTHYKAAPPQRLSDLFEDFAADFQEFLPTLERTFSQRDERTTLLSFDGVRGIRAVYDDIVNSLPRGGTFYRYSSASTARDRRKYVSPYYLKQRELKKIERYAITNAKTGARKQSRLGRYIKTIPPGHDLFEFNVTQLIYGDKVAFVDYTSETATILENRRIAALQKKIFLLLFNKL